MFDAVTFRVTICPMVAAVGVIDWVMPTSAPEATSCMPLDTVPESPGDEKLSVTTPRPVTDRSVNVAVPVASVLAVSVPSSVPLPEASATVTGTSDRVTTFPDASRRRTAGCGTRRMPLPAVSGGWVPSDSCVAVPTVTVRKSDTASTSGALENLSA